MTTKNTARLAGLLYLLTAITGGFGYAYIRNKVIIPGDAAATATNVLGAEFTFRAAIVATLVSQVLMFFFGLTLYRLLKEINRTWATIFLTSIIISVTLAIGNQLNNFAALLVLSPTTEYLKVFSPVQLQSLAMMFLRLSGLGQGLLEIFWSPYYFIVGLFAIKYRFLPQVLGVLLILMGLGYWINLLDKFLIPTFHPMMFTRLAMSLGALGGLPTMLWLLIKGARVGSNE